MKYSFMGTAMIVIGLMGLVALVMFENVAVNNESEYYTLREAVKASMYESIDLAYYRSCDDNCKYGGLKISEEKFVANCTRRFFSSISGTGKGYQLTFYDIMESPPKVSVHVNSKTNSYGLFKNEETSFDGSFDINNALSAILEFDYLEQ
mgnify:CR=1 FL=1